MDPENPASLLDQSTKAAEENKNKINEVTNSVKTYASEVASFGGSIIDLMGGIETIASSVSTQLSKAAAGSTFFKLSILGVNEAFDALKVDGVTGFTPLTEQFSKLGKELNKIGASEGIEVLKKILPAAAREEAEAIEQASKKKGDSLEKTKSLVESYTEKIFKSADQHSFLKEQILQTAYQFGNFSTVAKAAGQNMEFIDTYTNQVMAGLRKTAKETGLYAEQVVPIYQALSKIPGAIEMTTEASFAGKTGIDNFSSALIQFSKGAKIPTETLIGLMSQAREQFNLDTTSPEALSGQAGQKMLEMFSLLSESSKKLGINYDTLKGTITSVSESFKYYGYAANDAIKIVHELARAHDSVGLSARNATDLASKFTQNLTSLSMGQKAFISQLTGGPGGLLGAAEFDRLLMEKPKEAMDKMRQALKSQMGEIVSTKDVFTQEDAARQMLQVRQLQAFGFQGGDMEAKRMLDLLKGSEMADAATQLGDVSESLDNTMKQAAKITAEETTPMKAMVQGIDEMRGDVNKITKGLTQYVFTGTKPRTTDLTDLPQFLQNFIKADVFGSMKEKMAASRQEAGTEAGQITAKLQKDQLTETTPSAKIDMPYIRGLVDALPRMTEAMGVGQDEKTNQLAIKFKEMFLKREVDKMNFFEEQIRKSKGEFKIEDIEKEWESSKRETAVAAARLRAQSVKAAATPTAGTAVATTTATSGVNTAGAKTAGAVYCDGCHHLIHNIQKYIEAAAAAPLTSKP